MGKTLKAIPLVIFICFYANGLFSQSYLGLKESNYIGVLGADLQPASIADSRYIVDVNISGFDVIAYNSYLGLNSSLLKLKSKVEEPDWETNYKDYLTENNKESHSLFTRVDMNLLSFMVSPNDKIAFGLSTRFRAYANIDGVSNEFAKLMYENLNVPSLWEKDIFNDKLDVQAMAWFEYAANYAQVVYDEGDHFVKAGGKLKLLQGIGAAYVFVNDFDYAYLNADTMAIYNVDVSYGHSENISIVDNNSLAYKFESNPGLGLDLGAVYEWRPEGYKNQTLKKLKFFETAPNKYKLRAGFSILDIGRIKYKKGGESNDFKANIDYWNVREIDVNNVIDWDTLMNSLFVKSPNNEEYFKMNLPTVINLNVDYNLYKTFFVNLNLHNAFQFKKNENKSHEITTYTISPRWDNKYFGFSLPLTYSFLDGFRMGTGIRLGPLYVGSSNMIAVFKNKNSKGIDFYFGARVPILKRPPKDQGDSSF